MITFIRRNIGVIIAGFGFVLLCILTFGDLGDILTEKYWQNVIENFTSIGFLSISLVLIQSSIKQGVSEQSLQKGLNSDNTTAKFAEHKKIMLECLDKEVYLPYFLDIYNERKTHFRKREFLINNGYRSEESLFANGRKKHIRKYKKIRTLITASRIKWATTDIVYNKYGQIITLAEYRSKRVRRGIILGFIFMLGVTLLARGLFFDASNVPLYQKFIKLATYIVVMAVTSIMPISREYEKGAFGVPNELEEINGIWREFKNWNIPENVLNEVGGIDLPQKAKEIEYETESREITDGRADIQEKSEEIEAV